MIRRQSFRYFILPLLHAVLVFGSPAMARQQTPPATTPPVTTPPAAEPTAAPAAAPANGSQDQKNDPAPKKPEDPKKPDANAPDASIGKSKLEQETGTVNDRLFTVMPNYGTVETSKKLPPLTVGQKFKIATASAFDRTAIPFNGILAAIAQAKNDPSSWGQGWGAYGKRFGESFADNSIGTFMTTAIWPSMLHEDPRYYRMAEGPVSHRLYYSLNRLFVTRTDAGATRFNYSESIGNAAAAAISNVYY